MATASAQLERQRRYRESHREELRAKGRAYAARRRAADPAYAEKGRERIRRLGREQPEHLAEIRRRSYEKHAEKRREERRASRAADPEKTRPYEAALYAANPERAREASRLWAAAHPEQRRESYRRWCRENPDRKREHDRRRRARKAGAEGSFTEAEFRSLCERHEGRCVYCGERPEEITADHIIPLTRGGSDWIENIAPACRPCNSRKRDRTADEFQAVLS